MEFPILYGLDKQGNIKVWKATCHMEEEVAVAIIEYGFQYGKKMTTRREYTEGKNIGKANETTPWEQCVSETRRKWLDKKEKENYSEEISNDKNDKNDKNEEKEDKNNKDKGDKKVIPMLAATYDPTKPKRNDIRFPCSIQPKLDGFRCICYMDDGKVVTQSRTGARFVMDHIADALSPFFRMFPDAILDGELYTADMPFEVIAGLIKSKKRDAKKQEMIRQVHYHIYDMVHSTWTFLERWKWLQSLTFRDPLHLVETRHCPQQDVRTHFLHYVAQGYEGIMLRNDAKYQHNRTSDLQKYKEFMDDEFTIIGYDQGEGRDQGTVIWICQTKEGTPFSVRPKGTIEQRKEWFQDGNTYIGKKLTVTFQEWSDAGVPRFPVGKAIRDE